MPDYAPYLIYGLLTIGVVSYLGYIANSIAGEDAKAKDTDRNR